MLAPRDSFRLFRHVRNTFDPLNPTTVQVASENPDRVVLLFGSLSGAAVWISTDPAVQQNQGLLIPANGQPIVLSHALHGPLVSRAWFGAVGAGANLIVLEEVLEKLPPGGG